jgi:hypothetical protein
MFDAIRNALDQEIEKSGLAFRGEEALRAAHADRSLKYIGAGRHREVFYHCTSSTVIKIPMGEWGLASNDREAYVYASTNENGWFGGIRYGACFMEGALLVMEYLQSPRDTPMPGWADSVDGQQVGVDVTGQFAAYDYGY